MISDISRKEEEIMLFLFKNHAEDYNAHTISKELDVSHKGALNALKKLKNKSLLKSKKMGRATFYKPSLEEEYARKFISLMLTEEARNKKKWLEEFKELYPKTEIVLLFGSILKNEKKAKDIDLLLVYKEEKQKDVNKTIKQLSEIQPKNLHITRQKPEELRKNLRKKDKALLNAVKGVVLHGQEQLVDAVKDVTSRKQS